VELSPLCRELAHVPLPSCVIPHPVAKALHDVKKHFNYHQEGCNKQYSFLPVSETSVIHLSRPAS
jgi:hypothetical protein